MASLKDIRRQIASVKNTQQITKAMKLVAASKLRRAQMAIQGARPFANKLEELTGRLIADLTLASKITDPVKQQEFLKDLHPLLQNRLKNDDNEKIKVALLVVTSDRGLCGAYNSNAIKAAWKLYNELLTDVKYEVQVYFVGKRGFDFFGKRGVRGTFFDDIWLGKFSTVKSDKVANLLTGKFLAAEVDKVEVVYTEFRSAISQVVTLKQLLPLSVSIDTAKADESSAPYIYEPSRAQLLNELLPKQVQTQFYRVMADSLASELGARMTAMDNATSNAGDMISNLTLIANRVRQAAITKELMEIIGGAEALK